MGIKKLHVIEGNSQRLDGGSMFGNAPKMLWEKWIIPDSKNRITMSTRALLVQTDDDKNILFEVGIGAFFDPKLRERYGVEPQEHVLLKNLEAIGVKERDIDAVVLSHLHFDHAGGLLPEYGVEPVKLLFPNADYYVGKEHWEYAKNPNPRQRASFIPLIQELLEYSDRLVLVEGSKHPDLDFGVSFLYSSGHTIGLMMSNIALKTGQLLFVSDFIPGIPWIHVPITMGFDRFPEMIVDEKIALYDALIAQDTRLFFTHDPKTPCAILKKDEKGKYYGEPISMNELL